MGTHRDEAIAARRVALALLDLPKLTTAAESGSIPWSSLRVVVSKATAETEEDWLEICREYSCSAVEQIVARTQKGRSPRALTDPETELVETRLTFLVTALCKESFSEAVQLMCHEAGRRMPANEVFENLVLSYVAEARKLPGKKAVKRAKARARLNIEARRERQDAELAGLVQSNGCEDALEPGLDGPDYMCKSSANLQLEGGLEENCDPAVLSQVGELLREGTLRNSGLENAGRLLNSLRLEQSGQPPSFHYGPATDGADLIQDEAPGYTVDAPTIGWVAVAAREESCPGNESLGLVRREQPHWQNPRLRYRPDARLATPAQRCELSRRDGFCCSNPGCPNHLWLHIHHIVFYCDGGKTIPDNLIVLCSKCHRNVHEGHLQISGSVGNLEWRNRAGVLLKELARPLPGLGLLSLEPDLSLRWSDWDDGGPYIFWRKFDGRFTSIFPASCWE